MAMSVFRIVTINHPFLQLAPLPDFWGEQFISPGREGCAELRIHAECAGCFHGVVE